MGGQSHTAGLTWREAFAGDWRCDNAGWIWADSLKGGRCHVADVRGWGYLTGGGSGALGLSGEQGAAIQDQVGRVLAAAPELLEAAESGFLALVGLKLAMAVEDNGWQWPDDAPETVSIPAERLRAAIAKAKATGESAA